MWEKLLQLDVAHWICTWHGGTTKITPLSSTFFVINVRIRHRLIILNNWMLPQTLVFIYLLLLGKIYCEYWTLQIMWRGTLVCVQNILACATYWAAPTHTNYYLFVQGSNIWNRPLVAPCSGHFKIIFIQHSPAVTVYIKWSSTIKYIVESLHQL